QVAAGRLVVVGRTRSGVRQDSAVEDAAGDDGDAALRTEGKQLDQPGLVEQRVPAGEEEAVEVSLAGEPRQHRGLVHAGADRADHTLPAEPVERGVRPPERL